MPPLVLSVNDSETTNNDSLSDAPAVWITGDRIRFINSESGRAITTTAGVAAIRMDGADGVVINQAGGIIRSAISSFEPQLVIQGSAGSDRVENAGTINGLVALGEGSDTYVSRGGVGEFNAVVDLGGGDDYYYLRGLSSFSQSTRVDGGAGVDRYVIFEIAGNVDGPSADNFEILDLRVNGGVESFHGLETIIVDFSATGHTFSALRFFNTPDADVQILVAANSGSLSIYDRSAIGSVTGSALNDSLDLGNDTLVSGTIDLGAGDDYLSIRRSQFSNPQQALIGEEIDGGSGTDNLVIYLQGGDIFDAANLINFEKMFVSTFVGAGTPFILRNVDIPLELTISQATVVRLESSGLSGGSIILEPTASLTITAGSSVGMVTSFVPFPIDTVVSDDTKSISIVNEGQIVGDVRMYIGDDVVDSRSGTVGGHILGYSGNDTILTDLGDNWLDGGAGADYLSAGVGNDVLIGGSAGDTLVGGSGADTMAGGTGDDFYYVEDAGDVIEELAGQGSDNVAASNSYVLNAGAAVEFLSTTDHNGTASINLTGNEFGQVVIGNAGSNFLRGGGGADALEGLGGNDFLFVDADDVVIEGVGGGTDNVLASTSYTLNAGQAIEFLSTTDHGGTAAINLIGNDLGQLLIGNAGSNRLDGGGGADGLQGLGGNDFLFVDANDFVIEAVGGGTDNVLARTNFALNAGQEVEFISTTNHGGTEEISLVGNEFGQIVIGNAAANIIDGGLGADYLQGLGGNDIFAFTTGLGNGNVDGILDFTTGDRIGLDDGVFAGIGGPGAMSPNAFRAGTAAADADDRIIYDAATGNLYFDADGNGAGAQVLFANVIGHPVLTASDFTVI